MSGRPLHLLQEILLVLGGNSPEEMHVVVRVELGHLLPNGRGTRLEWASRVYIPHTRGCNTGIVKIHQALASFQRRVRPTARNVCTTM